MRAEPAALADLEPQWRRLHPVTIIRELLGTAWTILLAVVVLGALQGGTVAVLEIVVPVYFLGLAVARYYSTRYAITADAVLWRRGVLFRRRVEIPRSRIQNVSSGADVLGRMFGLRTVTVSTAGSEGELQLALVSTDEASFLVGELLGRRDAGGPLPGPTPPPPAGPPMVGVAPPPARAADGGQAAPGGPPPDGAGPPLPWAPPPSRTVVRLTTGELVTYALTGIGAGTVVAAVVLGAVSLQYHPAGPLLVLAFLVARPVLGVLDLNDFELTVEPDRLRVRHGLLATRDKWARRERIQVLAVDRPVLRGALGYETVSVATADATVGSDSDLSLSSPLAPRGSWPALAAQLVEETALAEAGLRPISPLAVRRRTVRWGLGLAVPLALGAGFAALAGHTLAPAVMGAAAAGWVPMAWLLARRAQRLDGWDLDERHLLVRRGVLASRLWLLRRAKVQSVTLTATPLQRRLGLASVLVDSANVSGGSIVVQDLPRPLAEDLATRLVELADRVFLPDGV
jgi:putative membrane protein